MIKPYKLNQTQLLTTVNTTPVEDPSLAKGKIKPMLTGGLNSLMQKPPLADRVKQNNYGIP